MIAIIRWVASEPHPGQYQSHNRRISMSTEQNKAIARRIEELWNDRNVEVIDELFTEDYHDHHWTMGRRAVKESVIALFAAGTPPDLHVTIEDQIAVGDKVVTRMTFSLTHSVKFFGAAPTGKHISWTGIDIHRLEGGKIVERWGVYDDLGLRRQLGTIASTIE
jgi:predicted ester cyclase